MRTDYLRPSSQLPPLTMEDIQLYQDKKLLEKSPRYKMQRNWDVFWAYVVRERQAKSVGKDYGITGSRVTQIASSMARDIRRRVGEYRKEQEAS